MSPPRSRAEEVAQYGCTPDARAHPPLRPRTTLDLRQRGLWNSLHLMGQSPLPPPCWQGPKVQEPLELPVKPVPTRQLARTREETSLIIVRVKLTQCKFFKVRILFI